jgi:HlyD family secretion protein
LTITERGQLEAAENSDVVCRVKARSANSTVATTIRWVVDDGTQVKRGDRLVQLDDSSLYEQLKDQKIKLDNARSAWVQADTQYEIVKSQNVSDIATAKLLLELAVIDLEKYVKGEYVASSQDLDGKLMIARSDLAMWEERAAWSARMAKPGRRYVTQSQSQSDDARLKSAQIAVSKALEDKRVLEKYMMPRTVKDFQGKIDEAKRAVERVEAQARAKDVQAEAARNAALSVYDQERVRYQDIEDEIKKCLILAPQDGLVVYYVPEQSRFGSGSQQSIVAQGEPVREGQKLMRIPDLSRMVVNTRVHEAMVSRVRGEKWRKTGFTESMQAALFLVPNTFSRMTGQAAYQQEREEIAERYRTVDLLKTAEGQPAHVRVDAFPDRTMAGEVKTVATVASQQDFFSADVKVYPTLVEIKDSTAELKPGMSAEVTIYTDSSRDSCLTVPVQAILGSVDMGKTRRIYVLTPSGPEPREVVIGLSNDKMAEVESGLVEGDQVIVNARMLLSDKEKAALGEGRGKDKNGKDKGGKGKDKGKGGPPPGKDGNGKDGNGKGAPPV